MNSTPSGKRSAAVLELLLQRSRMSPRQFAEVVGVSHTTVYARLRGEDWTYRTKAVYAEVFNVPEHIFDMTVTEAARWLLDHDRFERLDPTDPHPPTSGDKAAHTACAA